ncbi:hypothetical protein SADUNF_Sadunf15G0019300 [Salix dunnii]|uniref:Uncharacterized protein n=1 Tax=Salix dunnii TaxID=1413687 RepID=A0A835MI65_9ROSI|nr:hypothetical protein SADUNF_Sadunf15G0019300 [Salix dunnii]
MGDALRLVVGVMGITFFIFSVASFSSTHVMPRCYDALTQNITFLLMLIYLWFTSAKGKASYLNFICQTIGEIVFLACLNYQCYTLTIVFCITTAISSFSFHDHHHWKIFAGSVALMASVAMYGSPLVVVWSHLYLFLIHLYN